MLILLSWLWFIYMSMFLSGISITLTVLTTLPSRPQSLSRFRVTSPALLYRSLSRKLSALKMAHTPASTGGVRAAHEALFQEGLKIRYEVAGKAYVDKALQNGSSDFARPMQELVTEACWGSVWSRPGLERKTRSMLNIAMLSALNRGPELAVHVRGALNNGASEVEIREVLLQVSIYCGMPAGLEGFKIAEKVIKDSKEEEKTA